MKITPLEIRQKEFEKKLRGYDKDEVTAFLLSLSNEWERVLDTNKELTLKLQHAEKEVAKLREVESSLYKTLKTAEDTGANLIDQSNKAAELHMKETQMRAEALMNEAKSKAKAMMEKAEVEARQIIEELQEAVKGIEQNHRDIENHRQNAIAELKNLSVDLIEKVERTNKEQKKFRFDDYAKRVKELARESGERIKSEDTELKMPETPKMEELTQEKEEEPEPEAMKKAKPEVTKDAGKASTPKSESPERNTKVEQPRAERISRTVIVDPEEEVVIKEPTVSPVQKEEEPQPVAEKKPEPEEPVVEEESVVAEKEIEKPEVPEPEIEEQFESEAVLEETTDFGDLEEEFQKEEAASKEESPKEEVEEPVMAEEEPAPKDEPKEKKGSKTSKTVSFFDQLESGD